LENEEKMKFLFQDECANKIKDVIDVFKFTSEIHALGRHPPSGATGALWLRGQSNLKWKLLPKIGRTDPFWFDLRLRVSLDPTETTRMKEVEYNLLHRFRRYAHSFLKREPSQWETISLAQHYGLPTRLLDWSSNPLVALYFACEANHEEDGAVFAATPSKFWKYHINVYNDESVAHKHVPDPRKVKGFRLVYPMMSSERLVAQSGTFTIQSPWQTLEEQSTRQFGPQSLEIVEIIKWKVPKESKKFLASQLHRAGISHQSLFPDLGGVAVGLLRGELLREHPGSRA
jgi:hypothetical protein